MLTTTVHHSPAAVSAGGSLRAWLRGTWRLVMLGGFFARALTEGAVRALLSRGRFDRAAQARWLQKLSQKGRSILGVEITVTGTPAPSGLVVCNHLSYLDIVALGSITPLAFLSKREVRNWPIIGRITEMAGTLYITREDPKEVVRLSTEFEELVQQGIVVALFPEGTSSDGSSVLPFRSALLEPAVKNQWSIQPAWIGYSIDDGSVEDEVCYWRDMTFFPHLLNLVTKERIRVEVRFGEMMPSGDCRKALARELRTRVCELGGKASMRVEESAQLAHA